MSSLSYVLSVSAFLLSGALIGFFISRYFLTTASEPDGSLEPLDLDVPTEEKVENLPRLLHELANRVDPGPVVQNKLSEIGRLVQGLAVDIERLVRDSRTDALTGLWNRRALDEQVPLQFNLFRRYNTPLCVVMVDIDHFKKLNDDYGHTIGDEALRHTARLLLDNLRDTDFVARFGGEEFVLLLPQTDLAGAVTAVERLHKRIQESPFRTARGEFVVNVSMGIAQARMDDNFCDVFARADEALLQAKHEGRNQIRIESGWSGTLANEEDLAKLTT